ncbi:MAG TPA: hypothetical protein VGM64_08610 [Lacunisphaera sp.]
MSLKEVMAELPKLTLGERDLLRVRLAELAGEEWMDEGQLSAAEKALIEERVAEHERNPAAAISWEMMEAKLKARYGL